MRRVHRIESGVGRFFAYAGLFLLVTFLWCIPVGVIGSSNIVWGEPNQYGRVDIPGTGIVHLPAGSVDGTVAMIIPGRGNETPTVLLPDDLALSVVAVDGSGSAVVTRHLGNSGNAMDSHADSQRHVWNISVPHDGDYHVTTHGTFEGLGVDVAVWFGHGPPIPGTLVPVIALWLAAITALIYWLVRRRRKPGDDSQGDYSGPVWTPRPEHRDHGGDDGGGDGVGELERLAALHRGGELTDAEFETEKHKLIERG